MTQALLTMLLLNSFPYRSINLNRRYDMLLADSIKTKLATLSDGDVVVQAHDFHLRRPSGDTKKYSYKCYDEVMMAPQTHFAPHLFDHSHKLAGRRTVWQRSTDLYDFVPNDPVSTAQTSLYQMNSRMASAAAPIPGTDMLQPNRFGTHLLLPGDDPAAGTHSPSAAGSPGPGEGASTPLPPGAATPSNAGPESAAAAAAAGTLGLTPREVAVLMWEGYERSLPIAGLDRAVIESVHHAAKGDEKKVRDFLASVMVVGGGSKVAGLNHYLEERLRALKGPDWGGNVIVSLPPRELDPQVIVWKGASVFGKLRGTNDSWIGQRQYDMLGARLLTHKCMWTF